MRPVLLCLAAHTSSISLHAARGHSRRGGLQRLVAEVYGHAGMAPHERHRFSRPSELVPLGLDLGEHGRSSLHLVCAKSALGVARVRVVAQLLAEEIAWAQLASDALVAKPATKPSARPGAGRRTTSAR